MGRKSISTSALLMDARIMLKKKEFVCGMGQSSNVATMKDARIMLRKEECALGMGPKRR